MSLKQVKEFVSTLSPFEFKEFFGWCASERQRKKDEEKKNPVPILENPRLINEALLIFLNQGVTSISALSTFLPCDSDSAEKLWQVMVREGFISGEVTLTKNGTILISMEELERRIDEEKVKEQKEIEEAKANERKEQEIFEAELMRLSNSEKYTFIIQFAKKYGENPKSSELAKLQDLLNRQGFIFSSKQIKDILDFAVDQQKYRDAKSKIISENPSEVRDIIKVYLSFYRPDDGEMFEVLKGIIEEKDLFDLFENNPGELKKEVRRIEREIELEIFEKQLLSDDGQNPALADLDGLDGYEFESFLKDLFSKKGYQVEQTKLSGDQGADLVVVKFGEKKVIQAKRFGGKVGNKAVQEIMAAISLYQAQKGMVITNNYFTSSALELAKSNNIELIDRDGLEELINKHW